MQAQHVCCIFFYLNNIITYDTELTRFKVVYTRIIVTTYTIYGFNLNLHLQIKYLIHIHQKRKLGTFEKIGNEINLNNRLKFE